MPFDKYTKEVWKGSVITSPLPPTLVTCGTEEKPNVFTVAWTGILCTQPPVTYISVRPERYSYELISETGEFVINLATEQLVKAVDLCGVKSGRNVDKFELTGLTREKAAAVSAPIIAECPVNIECKVRDKISLGTHDVFVADMTGRDNSGADGLFRRGKTLSVVLITAVRAVDIHDLSKTGRIITERNFILVSDAVAVAVRRADCTAVAVFVEVTDAVVVAVKNGVIRIIRIQPSGDFHVVRNAVSIGIKELLTTDIHAISCRTRNAVNIRTRRSRCGPRIDTR